MLEIAGFDLLPEWPLFLGFAVWALIVTGWALYLFS